jgi:RNA polymerase sigma factor (sigma-70 family)
MAEALRKQWPMIEAMTEAATEPMTDQDQRIADAVDREYAGLRRFIRRRVANQSDAEDILQEVFYELIEAYRMMRPVEQVTAWLFRVARNRIIDLFRRKKREGAKTEPDAATEDGDLLQLEEMLPSKDAGPEGEFVRTALAGELDAALDELPEEQREVFVAHELMGYSFKEIAKQTGVSVNTLLSRKHYAVLHLRERLQAIYEELVEG